MNYSGYFMFDGNAKKNEINILTTAEKVVSKKTKPLDMLETTKDLLADEIIFMANGGKSIPWRFTDDDISVIEYVVGRDTIANSCQICTLTIKLNDYNKMTYKPCVIEGVISYKTKIFG